MNRSVSDILSQSAQQSIPQVRRLKCAIIDVLFPSRSFVVLRAGYGRQVVPADSSIDFGTYARPLVGVGNYAWIELNESDGTWHATKYEANATCTPTTLPNAPNVPLTTYKPPQNTAITFEPFRVDTNFFPHVASIGLLAPALKSPAQTIPGADVANVTMIGKYTFSGAASLSNPQHAMLGDYIFVVAETDDTVTALNASDIHHITWISNLSVVGIVPGDVAGAGKYLYLWTVAAGNYTLHVIDASNPYTMVSAGTFATGTRGLFGNTHMSIWSRANSIYLTYVSATAGVGTTRITTLNVTNPAAIALVGDYQPGTDTPVSADVSGQYVYCATSQYHLYVLDYSTPATPTVTSTTTLPSDAPNGDMVAGMDYLYYSSTKIYPVNVINPAVPVLGTGVASDPLNPHAQGYVPVRMMRNGAYLVCFLRSAADAIIAVFSLNAPMAPAFLTRVSDDFIFNSANAYLWSMFAKGRFVFCGGKDESANAALYVYGY